MDEHESSTQYYFQEQARSENKHFVDGIITDFNRQRNHDVFTQATANC